jgi:hypothetical protein
VEGACRPRRRSMSPYATCACGLKLLAASVCGLKLLAASVCGLKLLAASVCGLTLLAASACGLETARRPVSHPRRGWLTALQVLSYCLLKSSCRLCLK